MRPTLPSFETRAMDPKPTRRRIERCFHASQERMGTHVDDVGLSSSRKRRRCESIGKGSSRASKWNRFFSSRSNGKDFVLRIAGNRVRFPGRFRRHRFRPSSLRAVASGSDGGNRRTRLCVSRRNHGFGIGIALHVHRPSWRGRILPSKRVRRVASRQTRTDLLDAPPRPKEDSRRRVKLESYVASLRKGNALRASPLRRVASKSCADAFHVRKPSLRFELVPSLETETEGSDFGDRKGSRFPIDRNVVRFRFSLLVLGCRCGCHGIRPSWIPSLHPKERLPNGTCFVSNVSNPSRFVALATSFFSCTTKISTQNEPVRLVFFGSLYHT